MTVVAPVVVADVPGLTLAAVPIELETRRYLLLVAELAAIPTRTLGRPIGSVSGREDDIRRAIERLFTGF